jgi:hypothetical protein
MTARALFIDPIYVALRRWWLRHQIVTHKKTINAINDNIAAAQALRTELRQELSAMQSELGAM